MSAVKKTATKSAKPTREALDRLVTAARAVREKAYAPYSDYFVGAAILTKSGAVFTGTNVENATYGATICAERSAIVQMVAEKLAAFPATSETEFVVLGPADAADMLALAGTGTRKLDLLRSSGRATATLVFRAGFEWSAVSGPVRLVGPDDGAAVGLDVPVTIRSVFVAAGGTHEDWAEFDRVMAADRRCAVFVRADAITANPGL